MQNQKSCQAFALNSVVNIRQDKIKIRLEMDNKELGMIKFGICQPHKRHIKLLHLIHMSILDKTRSKLGLKWKTKHWGR